MVSTSSEMTNASSNAEEMTKEQQQQKHDEQMNDNDDNDAQMGGGDDDDEIVSSSSSSNMIWTTIKLVAAATFAVSAYQMIWTEPQQVNGIDHTIDSSSLLLNQQRRRLTAVMSETNPPSYMATLFNDLNARNKLFDDTPPEEIKYWFEYSGPLQVRFLN